MKEMVAELVHVIFSVPRRPAFARVRQEHPDVVDGEGLQERDIEAAMKVVHSRLERPTKSARHGAMRQLSPWEFSKFTPEARAALARLDQYEMLSGYEREMLLERASQMEGEVTLDDLDYLVSWLLCSVRDFETQTTLFQIFEGTKKVLN